MVVQTQVTTRPVQPLDRNQLAHLIHFGTYVHRHLDWKPPLDWIGREPFFVAERGERVVAGLASPPDPPGIAWIRVFVCSQSISYESAWESLWPPTREFLMNDQASVVAAIPLQKWFRELLSDNGFYHDHNVISLAWDEEPGKLAKLPSAQPFQIREMAEDDLVDVFKIDSNAFGPLWQNATDSISLAFNQAVYASVVMDGGRVIGYQITTRTPYGAHLGRLATDPAHQAKGVGYALLHDLVDRLSRRNFSRISVNTQENNTASRALYAKMGFAEQDEAYPVYLFKFD